MLRAVFSPVVFFFDRRGRGIQLDIRLIAIHSIGNDIIDGARKGVFRDDAFLVAVLNGVVLPVSNNKINLYR